MVVIVTVVEVVAVVVVSVTVVSVELVEDVIEVIVDVVVVIVEVTRVLVGDVVTVMGRNIDTVLADAPPVIASRHVGSVISNPLLGISAIEYIVRAPCGDTVGMPTATPVSFPILIVSSGPRMMESCTEINPHDTSSHCVIPLLLTEKEVSVPSSGS